MIIYLVCFFLIILFSHILEKNKTNDGNKILKKVNIIIIIIIMTAFAGYRDENIGTDVLVYAKPVLNAVNNYGFSFAYQTANVECLFVVIAQIASFIDGNINTFLLLIQLIMSILIIKYALYEKETKNIPLCLMTYLCMFYGIGFNLMRQSIAMLIVLYGIRFIKQNKLLKYIITIIIATLFHTTAIFMISLYPIWTLLKKKDKVIYKFLIIAILVVAMLFILPILNGLISLGIVPEKFVRYVYAMQESTVNIQYILTIVKIILLFICYFIKSRVKDKESSNFAYFLLVIDIVLFQLGAITPFVERISYYFGIIGYMELLPRVYTIVKKDKFNKYSVSIIIYTVLILYFYVSFVFLGVSSIVPYTSQILHIS